MADKRIVNGPERTLGDRLLRQILEGKDRDGVTANQLLEAFFDGYPLAQLRLLFASEDRDVVATGAWLASELGETGRPLMDSVVVLLQHSYHKVRFWAIDSLLSHMEPTDVEAIQKVLALLGDPESSVRWKTMMFLLRVPSTILDAALEGELPAGSTRAHGDGLRLLTRDTQDSNRIVSGLTANDPLLRRYAAVAAALLSESNPSPLRTAMNSPDSDIRDFARDVAESRRIAPDTH